MGILLINEMGRIVDTGGKKKVGGYEEEHEKKMSNRRDTEEKIKML
jgi:hypothetical protein